MENIFIAYTLFLQGAFWGMLAGQIAGIIRMILDFVYPSPKCGEPDLRPAIIAKVHFTYFAAFILILTAVVAMVISLFTKQNNDVSLFIIYVTFVNAE